MLRRVLTSAIESLKFLHRLPPHRDQRRERRDDLLGHSRRPLHRVKEVEPRPHVDPAVQVRLFYPLLPHSALMSAFALQMALLGFLPLFFSFNPSRAQLSKFTGEQALGERAHAAGAPERIGALILIFFQLKKSLVLPGIRTLAACVTGQCF